MAGISDLLNWMDNQRRTVGRNLSDLVRNPKDYLTGVANELPNTVREYAADPMNFVGGKIGGVGMTAWHGSPHKFDKFSLDKIGTGEGAQAYGHGLYLAESPEVAQTYQKNLSQFSRIDGKPIVGNKTISSGARTFLLAENADLPKAIQNAKDSIARRPDNKLLPPILKELESLNPDSITKSSTGQLYKTDIPDEAVARFLDWDKPLSQQNEFVQSIIARQHGVSLENYRKMMKLDPDKFDKTGKEMVSSYRGAQPDEVTSDLFANGIPGIRYLDGGSRSAGQGSSNFVVFDPEMIRILERNGETTGLKPWKPGEYRPINDLLDVRTD